MPPAGGGWVGSIPASAGEPWPVVSLPPDSRVYPRECGGTAIEITGRRYQSGLSPRVRGNPSSPYTYKTDTRSIPASAGEPAAVRVLHAAGAVYPRECGGTIASLSSKPCIQGLSPRVRGNPVVLSLVSLSSRSIPASAGEPSLCALVPDEPRVYPRECGGTISYSVPCQQFHGLSPRVRGNRCRWL